MIRILAKFTCWAYGHSYREYVVIMGPGYSNGYEICSVCGHKRTLAK